MVETSAQFYQPSRFDQFSPRPHLIFVNTPEHAVLTPEELLKREIKTQRLEMIPLQLIQLYTGTFDPAHAEALKQDMQLDWGQIQPITVRARLDEKNGLVYDLIDGFHRTHAKLNTPGEKFIRANVLYKCSDAELFDQRIFASPSVETVQFSRIVLWMRQAFEFTEWQKKGLTVTQVFTLASWGEKRKRNRYLDELHLSPADMDEIQAWASQKATLAQKKVGWVASALRIADLTNDVIISQVRTGGGGHDGRGTLTAARLKNIVEVLPHEYELQTRIIDQVLDHNITAPGAYRLSRDIALVKDNPQQVAQILENAQRYKYLDKSQNKTTTPESEGEEKKTRRKRKSSGKEAEAQTTANIPVPTIERSAAAPLTAPEIEHVLPDFKSFMQTETAFLFGVYYAKWFYDLSFTEQKILVMFYTQKKPVDRIASELNLSKDDVATLRDNTKNKYQVLIIEWLQRYEELQEQILSLNQHR